MPEIPWNWVQEKLGQVQVPACPNGVLYTVRSGDTLFGLARRFGVSLDDLIAANPQLPDPSRLRIGQRICIPSGMPSTGVCCVPMQRTSAVDAEAGGVVWIRRRGATGFTVLVSAVGLPAPSVLGETFQTYVFRMDGVGSEMRLVETVGGRQVRTGVFTTDEISLRGTEDVVVRVAGTTDGQVLGPVVLEASVGDCLRRLMSV
ncbi:LysM peptidoglycan-binding domain-containing protein [Limnochorda pilosa]|uniref:LysM domain-containing protein n=1 Tax=Limnochorda pilosa TaxID=1555112 RepID=A0A0K2SFQ4_LIMPI|nr:LysM domain-containing protein [Limnochorda pilosa]BAS25938.1 hypothetical protein LIP_0081 [Limnochorda pilosa]